MRDEDYILSIRGILEVYETMANSQLYLILSNLIKVLE